MKPYYQDDHITLYHGDCIETMRTMPEGSVDSIVTDPPYGLGFMGKKWDELPPGEEWARECLRVLKPGGHILAFGGTRTWHRLAVAIEDAGFEMRDSLAWLYGSGFPKHRAGLKPAFEPVVMARKPFKGSLAANEAIHGTGALSIDESRLETTDKLGGGGYTTPVSEGWDRPFRHDPEYVKKWEAENVVRVAKAEALGRWPANVLLDEHTAELLDQQSGVLKSGGSMHEKSTASTGIYGEFGGQRNAYRTPDSGGASRFFYVAKAPKSERPVVDGNAHPTVKPLALMRWLCKLVTPGGGTILDPFAGSGTTIEAATLEGFNSIGIERETEYLPLIEARIARAKPDNQTTLDIGALA